MAAVLSIAPARAARTAPSAASILDVLRAGVIATSDAGIVLSANVQATRILRQSEGELVGRPVASVLGPLEELRTSGELSERPVTLHDGTTIALGFTVSTVRDAVAGDHHVVLFQENSPLLELRRQRDRLLQIAVIGEVMPTLLHEIRNPLAAVTAMVELLAEEAAPELQADLHAVLSQVRRITLGLQGMGSLVHTMHSGTNCAVDLAVREACRLLEQSAAQRSVELRAVGPDLPLLPIDRGAVCGVVFNLVKNAIEACPEGGHVDVDVRVVDGELVLSVSDDGVGMPAETIARCRELFYTTKEYGSGVGLALCQRVAEASGGGLDIESLPGRGTRVTMRVPAHAPASEQRRR